MTTVVIADDSPTLRRIVSTVLERAGLDAGCSAYLLKSDFDQNELVETVRRLVGR